jgi:hypothetical protein
MSDAALTGWGEHILETILASLRVRSSPAG